MRCAIYQDMSTDYPAVFRSYILACIQATRRLSSQLADAPTLETLEQALHILDFALDLPEAWTQTCALLLELAPRLEQAGMRGETMAYLERGLETCAVAEDWTTAVDLHFHLGVLFGLQSRYQEALHHFEASGNHAQDLALPVKLGRALNRQADMALRQRRHAESTRLVEAALPLVSSDLAEQGYSFLVQANIAHARRDWELAIELYRRSLALWQATGDRRRIAWGLTNLGTALRPAGQHEEASRCYEEAITLFQEIHDPVHQAVAEMNLGNVHLTRGQWQEALAWYRRAEPVFRRTQDRRRLGMVYNNMGMAYRHLKRWTEAEAVLDACVGFYAVLGHELHQADALDGLGLVYQALGQTTDAIAAWQQALHLLQGQLDDPWARRIRDTLTERLQAIPQDAQRSQTAAQD